MRLVATIAPWRAASTVMGFVTLTFPLALAAQTTPYLSAHDPAYQDLDALVAAGLIADAVHGDRPDSRLSFARWIAEARDNAEGRPGAAPRFQEALDRLEKRFAPEISGLCSDKRSVCTPVRVPVVAREAAFDATWSNSPDRAVPTPYDFQNGAGSESYIDAALNPLLQEDQGRRLADGGTFGAEASVDVTLGTHFAGELYPRVWGSALEGGGTSGGLTLQEGYLRALFGNLAIDLGRNQVEMGQGREGGPVLSYNPRGLDLVRFSLDRPARLPWIFHVLGPFQASALVADLGRGSDTPHSKLIVFNGSIRPHPNLELGATLGNHQGGQNAPTATFLQRLEDIFLIYPQGDAVSDKVIGGNMRLTLPSIGTELYVDGMTTDDHGLFRFKEMKQSLWNEAVWVLGARRMGLGPEGRFDLWAEARHSGVRPYTHHQFTSGWTLNGRILGDPIGPLARGLSAGLDWTGPTSRLGVAGAWERYYGDHYTDPPGGLLEWIKTQDGPDETRTRLTADWTTDMGTTGRFIRVRAGFEHVHQFDFTPGNDRNDGMVQVQMGWRW